MYVTGCLGFIGSHFTRLALNSGWYVKGIDKLTYAADLNCLTEFYSYPSFDFAEGHKDINDLDFISDCDIVVNFAAESHVDNSIEKSDNFMSSNILGVKNLLELIRAKNVNSIDRPKFIQISTDEVYGDIDEGSHVETDILKPSNPYSASKASADMLVMAWARTYGLKYNIIRPTNNYGCGQYPEKLIPLAIKNLLRGKKIKLHNRGTPIRNWLHVEDTAKGIMTVIEKGKDNNIYNIAGGFEQSNLETALLLLEIVSGKSIVGGNVEKYLDMDHVRFGQDVRYSLNDDKLRALGWKPVHKFEEALQEIVKHDKENIRW